MLSVTDKPAPIRLKKGETAIYNLGQNMVGWVRFKVKGTSGTEMKLRFGEMLNDTGDKSRGDDGPARKYIYRQPQKCESNIEIYSERKQRRRVLPSVHDFLRLSIL